MKTKRLWLGAAILLVVTLLVLFAADFMSNAPWHWVRNLDIQDISDVSLVSYGQEFPLETEEIESLIAAMRSLNRYDMEQKQEQTSGSGVTLFLDCGGETYRLTRVDVPYGQFEMTYGGEIWCFYSDAMNEVLNDVLMRLNSNDLFPAVCTLSLLLTIPQDDIMESLAETMHSNSSKTVDDTVREMLSDYVSEEFRFLSDFGSLWLPAQQHGFSVFLTELKVTNNEDNENHFNYEALLDITLENGETEQIHLEGMVRCNRNRKVTSISQTGKELDAFLDTLYETAGDPS